MCTRRRPLGALGPVSGRGCTRTGVNHGDEHDTDQTDHESFEVLVAAERDEHEAHQTGDDSHTRTDSTGKSALSGGAVADMAAAP